VYQTLYVKESNICVHIFNFSNLLSLIFLAKLQSYVCIRMLVSENGMDVWEVVACFGFVAMGV
jgi:hypothetical protein